MVIEINTNNIAKDDHDADAMVGQVSYNCVVDTADLTKPAHPLPHGDCTECSSPHVAQP